MTVRASSQARATRRSSAANGSTSRDPAPASGFPSSRTSRRSTAARSSSTKAPSAACAPFCGCHACDWAGTIAGGQPARIRKNLPGDIQPMRRTLIFIVTLTSLGLVGCSGVGSGGGSPSVAAPPTQPAVPAIPTGRRAWRRPRRAARRGAHRRRSPGGVGSADRRAQFGSTAVVARFAWRVRLCRGRRRDGRRLSRLFADHLCRRPAQPRPGRRLQTAGRKLENDELRF